MRAPRQARRSGEDLRPQHRTNQPERLFGDKSSSPALTLRCRADETPGAQRKANRNVSGVEIIGRNRRWFAVDQDAIAIEDDHSP
jgi:hypothetical protein